MSQSGKIRLPFIPNLGYTCNRMSRRLMDMMNKVVLREGTRGKARLSLAAGRVPKMIDRYRRGESIPPTDVARAIALECGAGDGEADELAFECSPEAKKAS